MTRGLAARLSILLTAFACLPLLAPVDAHTPPALKAENARLKQQVSALQQRVATLETQSAQNSGLKDRLAAAEALNVALAAERDEARRIAAEATQEANTARQQ
jgi:hypothetical protein